MAGNILEVEFMTGKIVIDLEKCKQCKTKACVAACSSQIFKPDGRVVSLNMTNEEIRKGGCTESLACELECQLRGEGGLSLVLPMPEFDRYAEMMKESGQRMIYEEE